MNRLIKFQRVLLFLLAFCTILSGCGFLQDKIEEYSSDKEQCFLITDNATQFLYKGETYTILDDTVPNENLGDWIGYIRQLAVVDETGNVLFQEYIEETTFHTLEDLSDKITQDAYLIPYLNVYTPSQTASYLIVDVNGAYHKAVLSCNVTDFDSIFEFRTTGKGNSSQ